MNRQRDYLSSLPADVIAYCFRFVTDDDLRRARWTSRLFLGSYCRYYAGSDTPTVHECRSYISLCELGYQFPSVTSLNIQLPYNSFLFKHLTIKNFPKVKKLTVNYIHLGCMPHNENVTTLRMIDCTFNGRKPGRKKRKFPFDNVETLLIDGGSTLSANGGLPKLLELRKLAVVDTTLTTVFFRAQLNLSTI